MYDKKYCYPDSNVLKNILGLRNEEQYKEEEEFYPLQLRYVLNENPANLEGEACLRQKKIHFRTTLI